MSNTRNPNRTSSFRLWSRTALVALLVAACCGAPFFVRAMFTKQEPQQFEDAIVATPKVPPTAPVGISFNAPSAAPGGSVTLNITMNINANNENRPNTVQLEIPLNNTVVNLGAAGTSFTTTAGAAIGAGYNAAQDLTANTLPGQNGIRIQLIPLDINTSRLQSGTNLFCSVTLPILAGAAVGTYPINVQNSGGFTTSLTQTLADGFGEIGFTSTASTLTITATPVAPTITTQPQATSGCVGGSAMFTVAASGTPTPTFQWRKGGVNIADGPTGNGGTYAGTTTTTLTISNLAAGDAGMFDCVATNSQGNATSNMAALTVNVPVSFTANPTSQSLCAGGNVSFAAAVNAGATAPVTFQWQKNNVNIANGPTGNGSTYSNVTTNTMTITGVAAADAGSFRCVATNTCGSVNSNAGTLTVNTAPAITTQPVAQAACPGSNATFTVAATGTALTFQWRKGGVNIANGPTGNGSTYSGVNTNTLTITGVVAADAGMFDVVIMGTCPPSATSNMVALSVNANPTINTQPMPQTVCAGASASFTVAASGTGLTFQWRKGGVNLTNGGNISGATTATLTINPTAAADAANYDCVITSVCAGTATTNAVALTVNAVTAVTAQPTNQMVCVGSTATFTATAVGTNLTFQWRKGGANIANGATGNGSMYAGVTTNTLMITGTALADAGSFDLVITGTCGNATTNAATLTVNTAPMITTQPTAQTVCAGTNATFTVAATGTGLTFQWRKGGTNLSNGGNISGATTATLTVSNAQAADAANYDCVVTGVCPPAATSNAVALTVNPITVLTAAPQSLVVIPGQPASFTATATGTTPLTFNWFKGVSPGGTLVRGPIAVNTSPGSDTFTIPATVVGDTGSYYVTISGGCGTVMSAFTLIVGATELDAIYVADTNNNRIQRFKNNAWTVLGLAGPGVALGQFRTPEAVVADITGMKIYVADTGNNRIQFSLDGGATWQLFAGTGSGLNQTSAPQGLALDTVGNLYVSDAVGGGRVLRFNGGTPGTGILLASLGNAVGTVNQPRGLAVDTSNNLFIADTGNNRIQRLSAANTVTPPVPVGNFTVIATLGSGLTPAGQVRAPEGVAVDNMGNLYVADTQNNRTLLFPGGAAGAATLLSTGPASGAGQVRTAEGITVCQGPVIGGATGTSAVIVGDTQNNRIIGSTTPTVLASYVLVGTPNNVGSATGQFRTPSKIR
ncbi:MAG: immunoglobulin domain-containing protein [Blastocatellia bacterium]|nr:immunoglobulin domain-containing protein [Blastocatellia bacterium]